MYVKKALEKKKVSKSQIQPDRNIKIDGQGSFDGGLKPRYRMTREQDLRLSKQHRMQCHEPGFKGRDWILAIQVQIAWNGSRRVRIELPRLMNW